MKKSIGFIILLMVCSLLLAGCWINKTAYGLQHASDPAPDPATLQGVTIVVQSSGDHLYNVIDLEYDSDNDIIHYVRNDRGQFIAGVVANDNAEILNGSGYLKYNKEKKEWFFYSSSGMTYDIYQDNYRNIVISGDTEKK